MSEPAVEPDVLEPFVHHVYQDSYGFWCAVEEKADGKLELFAAAAPVARDVLETCFTRAHRTAMGAIIHLEPQRRDLGSSKGWHPDPPRRVEN